MTHARPLFQSVSPSRLLYSARLLRSLALMAVVLIATGCYMPARFDAEIEIERTGYYKFFFDGYLADVGLFEKLKNRKIGRAEEQETVAQIKSDIERDPSASDFKYFKQGHFGMKWQREGDLLRARTVTFMRRNEQFFTLSFNKDTRQIGVRGRSLTRQQKNQLVELGLNMQGELRVITDAKVVSHNADSVKSFRARGPRWQVYIFRFNNIYRPTPSLNISLI